MTTKKTYSELSKKEKYNLIKQAAHDANIAQSNLVNKYNKKYGKSK